MRWVGVLGAVCVAVWARSASADEAAEKRFSLEYHAEAGCPDKTAFIAAVRARVPNALVASDAVSGFHIELRGDRASELTVILPEGSSRREIAAESCAEAAASMAVIVSMIIDTAATPEVAPKPEAIPEPEPAPAPAPSAAAAAPPVLVVPPRNPEPPSTSTSSLVLGVAGGLVLETAVAPNPPLGATLGIEGQWARTRWLSPSVRLEGLGTLPSSARTDSGSARLRLLAARLTGCIQPFSTGVNLRLQPCVVLMAGEYRAAGESDALNPRQVRMPWLAGGGALRGALWLWRGLSLEGYAGLTFLARRDRFVFSPNTLAYRVPTASVGFGLGVSWQFR